MTLAIRRYGRLRCAILAYSAAAFCAKAPELSTFTTFIGLTILSGLPSQIGCKNLAGDGGKRQLITVGRRL